MVANHYDYASFKFNIVQNNMESLVHDCDIYTTVVNLFWHIVE